MHVSVCLSAPEREERESAMEKAVGHLTPDSKGLFTWCPGWGWGTVAATLHPEGWLGMGWLDGEGVRRGETVWVGEDVRGMSQVSGCEYARSQSMTPKGWPLSVAKGMCGSRLGQEGL